MPSSRFTTESALGGALVPGLWVDWAAETTLDFESTAYANLSDYLISARYTRGSSPEITGAAQAGSGVFVVKNPDGLFDPDNAAGPLYGLLKDGAPIWFGVNDDGTLNDKGATVRGRFAGRITEIAPIPVAGAGDSTPTAEIICEDALGWYGRIFVSLDDDCGPAAEPAIVQHFTTDNSAGACEPATWPLPPGEGNLLIEFLVQRGGSTHDASIVPIGNTAPLSCDAATDIPGTEYTYADSVTVDGSSNPITLTWRVGVAGEPQNIRWGGTGGGLAGSARSRSYGIEVAGLSGAPTVTGSSADQIAPGAYYSPTTMISPDMPVPSAGRIFAVMAYSPQGPTEDPFDTYASSAVARAPAIDLNDGYAGPGANQFGPYSWCGYLDVPSAGTYAMTLDFGSIPPHDPWNPYGWLWGFWPS